MDAVVWLMAGLVLLSLMAMTLNYELDSADTLGGEGDFSRP